MSEFRDKLIALGRGQANVQDVGDALQSLLARQPDAAPRAQQLLDAARKAGMPENVYNELVAQLPRGGDETVFSGATWGAAPEIPIDDERTRLSGDATSASDGYDDATRIVDDETMIAATSRK
jgi:hypothetical protein